MSRWRLVDAQSNGTGPHVSTVVLSEEEAVESLALEALMHRMAGWTVTEGDDVIVCRRGALVRTVQRVEFDALNDPVQS